MPDLKSQIQTKFPEILLDHPLKPYSTFKIGGPADFFYRAKDLEILPDLLKFARENEIPYFVMGAGSNILFDDEGFRGLIIRIEAEEIEINSEEVAADSGVLIAKLIKYTIENGLTGLEKWVGLPGTVGGAVRGNAGCNGLETKDVFKSATLLNPKTGLIFDADSEYMDFSYRHSALKESGEIVLKAIFQLQKAEISTQEQERLMAEFEKNRYDKQPIGFTTGSFFKNPSPDQAAGYLIEAVGLKGKKHGNAQISAKHANFFLNLGNASSKDILALAELAKSQVKAKFDINLQEEVQIISPHGPAKLI